MKKRYSLSLIAGLKEIDPAVKILLSDRSSPGPETVRALLPEAIDVIPKPFAIHQVSSVLRRTLRDPRG
jgi:DNA-binding NtrC family response regulator